VLSEFRKSWICVYTENIHRTASIELNQVQEETEKLMKSYIEWYDRVQMYIS
jgi:hypothetical protein